MTPRKIVVGSRASALAVAQSMTVVDFLRDALPGVEIRLLTLKTTGDRILNRTLDRVGGKGLFVKELDEALQDGRADLTVHSLKDVPAEIPPSLPLLGFSRREDARDALVLPDGVQARNPALPIGSASPRRQLQLRTLFPGCEVRPVRGNVQTRLRKLDAGEFGALVLAAAGLKRLGLESRVSRYFTTAEMIPAAGQGILAVQGRAGEDYSYLDAYFDPDVRAAATCERAFVAELDGGCTSPVCAFACVDAGKLHLRGLYYEEHAGRYRVGEASGDSADAVLLGTSLARELRCGAGKEYIV